MAANQPIEVGPAAAPARWLGQFLAIALPLAIVALGVLLLVLHRRAWQAARRSLTDGAELAFQGRRYRRRLQTSGLLVLLGVAMEGGQCIAADKRPSLFVFFWCAVAMLAVWVLALAVCDVIATRMHLRQQMRQQLIERAKLQAELTRIQAQRDRPAPPGGE
jgi:hypothetical protein